MFDFNAMMMDPNFAAQMAQNVDPTFLLNYLNGAQPGGGMNAGPLAQTGMTTMGSSELPFDPMAAAGPYAAMLNPTPQPQPPYNPGMGPQTNPLDIGFGRANGTIPQAAGAFPSGLSADALAKLMQTQPKPATPQGMPAPVSPGGVGRNQMQPVMPFSVPQVGGAQPRLTLAQLLYGR